jgi:hypothetical protein
MPDTSAALFNLFFGFTDPESGDEIVLTKVVDSKFDFS